MQSLSPMPGLVPSQAAIRFGQSSEGGNDAAKRRAAERTISPLQAFTEVELPRDAKSKGKLGQAFYELVKLARDANANISARNTAILQKLGILDTDGQLPDATRQQVLKDVEVKKTTTVSELNSMGKPDAGKATVHTQILPLSDWKPGPAIADGASPAAGDDAAASEAAPAGTLSLADLLDDKTKIDASKGDGNEAAFSAFAGQVVRAIAPDKTAPASPTSVQVHDCFSLSSEAVARLSKTGKAEAVTEKATATAEEFLAQIRQAESQLKAIIEKQQSGGGIDTDSGADGISQINQRKVALTLDLIQLQNAVTAAELNGTENLKDAAELANSIVQRTAVHFFPFEVAELFYQAEQQGVNITQDGEFRERIVSSKAPEARPAKTQPQTPQHPNVPTPPGGNSDLNETEDNAAFDARKAAVSRGVAIATLIRPYLNGVEAAQKSSPVDGLVKLARIANGVQGHAEVPMSDPQRSIQEAVDQQVSQTVEATWSKTVAKLDAKQSAQVLAAIDGLQITPAMAFDLESQAKG